MYTFKHRNCVSMSREYANIENALWLIETIFNQSILVSSSIQSNFDQDQDHDQDQNFTIKFIGKSYSLYVKISTKFGVAPRHTKHKHSSKGENFFFHSCDYNTFSFYILRMSWESKNWSISYRAFIAFFSIHSSVHLARISVIAYAKWTLPFDVSKCKQSGPCKLLSTCRFTAAGTRITRCVFDEWKRVQKMCLLTRTYMTRGTLTFFCRDTIDFFFGNKKIFIKLFSILFL